MDKIRLQGWMDEKLKLWHIKSICSALGIDFEDVEGGTKSEKILDLIDTCLRTNKFEELVRLVLQFSRRGSRQTNKPLEIPYVVVSVRKKEAQKLLDEAGGSDFADLLSLFGVDKDEWLAHYEDNRDKWRPHAIGVGPIGDMMKNMENDLSSALARPIKFSSRSAEFFNDDARLAGRTYRELQKNPHCVVIVDVFSLCNSELKESIVQSQLGAGNTGWIYLVPATSAHQERVGRISKILTDKTRAPLDRFSEELDCRCQLTLSDSLSLRRSLLSAIGEVVRRAEYMHPDAWRYTQEHHDFGPGWPTIFGELP